MSEPVVMQTLSNSPIRTHAIGARLMRRCEQLAVGELTTRMEGLLNGVARAMSKLADHTDSASLKALCHDATRELQLHRESILQLWSSNLPRYLSASAPLAGRQVANRDQLKLDLAIDKLASRAEGEARPARQALHERLATLTHEPPAPNWPLSAAALGEAFVLALSPVDTDVRIKLALLRLLDAHVLSHLPGLFARLEQSIDQTAPTLSALPKATESGLTAVLTTLNRIQTSGLRPSADVPWSAWLGEQLPEGARADRTVTSALVLVDQVYAAIHQESDVPEALDNLINALRIPLLKVALLDKTALAQAPHPARMLLASMCSLAPALDEHSDASACLLAKMHEAVTRITREFASNIQLFTEVQSDFSSFLEKEQNANLGQQHQQIRQAQVNEELALALAYIDQDLAVRCIGRTLCEEIQALIHSHWRDVLVAIYLEEGIDSPRWEMAEEITDELIACADTTLELEQRQALAELLPQLTAALQEDLSNIAWEDIKVGGMFQQVATLVGVNLDGGQVHEPATADEWVYRPDTGEWVPASTMDTTVAFSATDFELPPLEPEMPMATVTEWVFDLERGKWCLAQVPAPAVASPELVVAEPRAEEPQPAAPAAEDPFLVQAKGIRLGDWIELRGAGGECLHARLAWKSELAGKLIFVNWRQQVVAQPSIGGLAVQLRRGTARALATIPLIDKAFDAVMQTLAGNKHI